MSGIGSYSLKWHGHAGHLNSTICSLHRSDAFTDVLLATSDGQFVGAHQFVLSSCSHYFHKMFVHLNQVPRAGKTVVVLPSEINYMTLNILLEYIYRGESIITDEQLPGIMKAARLLQVRGLYSENEVLDLRPKLQKPNKEATHGVEKMKPPQRILIPEVLYQEPKTSPRGSAETKRSNGGLNRLATTALSLAASAAKKQKMNESTRRKKNSLSSNNTGKVVIAEEIIIKEEPLDWDDDKSNDIQVDTFIKQEVEEMEVAENSFYVPLTCDLCHETFSTPALWVRHIDNNHPSTALAAGVRKSKPEESEGSEGSYSPLTCELCQRVFTLPVEWVRHVQSHTQQDIDSATTSTQAHARELNQALRPDTVERSTEEKRNYPRQKKIIIQPKPN